MPAKTTKVHAPTLQPTLCTLPSWLIAARKNLMDTGFYLADNSVHDNVHWVRDGRADRLAVKPAIPVDDVNGKADDSSAKYTSPPPDKIELAKLCAIVHISNHNFWLTADAGYRKPTSVWRELAAVKPSCTVEEPDMQPVRGDFKPTIDNLRKLQDLIATPGFTARKGFMLSGGISGQQLKVRHVLFEPLGNGELESCQGYEPEDSDGSTDAAEEAPGGSTEDDNNELAVFSIENWPTASDAAQAELEAIKGTHWVIPIPTYNVEGKLIKPDAYRHCLEGALVELYFNLVHWSIAAKNGTLANDSWLLLAPPVWLARQGKGNSVSL
ncbi:hypothetical protein PAXINDRAFT_156471 [Paxillus involutus ATCC 200175]|uniref:Uncharacterized protein n=1 Tax=Paxillus involutus ATCC 200175 TaxID=664439 RepID=A0A0C9TTE2_PAXIN|nr:hypothetical protein PAXINDRAFT_156471 [Paxillus involutus ATCC 200175]